MHPKSLKCLFVVAALACTAPALADDDASLHQVYEAAQSGHLDQAQQMMAQVLRDHPTSGKAHFVEAELDARQGRLADAKSELATAEGLDPGLPNVNQNSVRALQAQLSPNAQPRPMAVSHGSSFPWGLIIILLIVGAAIMMFLRSRRQVIMPYSSNPNGYMQPGMSPNYGPGPVSGGMGSGIVGGLASGLAVGAGVVAGEELAHHFLDGDRRPESYVDPNSQGNPGYISDPNPDMGGNDFGVSDSGSWDDNSSGGGGGDDWS